MTSYVPPQPPSGPPAPAGGAPQPMASASGQGGPSSTGYWIGGILLALGVLVAVVLMASGVSQIVATVSEYRSMDTPGEESFVLDRGEYRIYLFNEGAGGADVQVLDVEGNALPLNRTLNSDEVTLDSVVLDFAGWFETPTDGIYTVVVESDATGGLLFGPPIGDSAVAAAGRAGLGALLGGLLFVAGVVVMIVTAVRRGRAKRPPSLAGPYQPYPGRATRDRATRDRATRLRATPDRATRATRGSPTRTSVSSLRVSRLRVSRLRVSLTRTSPTRVSPTSPTSPTRASRLRASRRTRPRPIPVGRAARHCLRRPRLRRAPSRILRPRSRVTRRPGNRTCPGPRTTRAPGSDPTSPREALTGSARQAAWRPGADGEGPNCAYDWSCRARRCRRVHPTIASAVPIAAPDMTR